MLIMAKSKPKKPAIRKPRDFTHGKHQLACVSDGFYCDEYDRHLPDAIFIHCEEMDAKKTRKLAAWLIRASDYLEFSQNMKKRKI